MNELAKYFLIGFLGIAFGAGAIYLAQPGPKPVAAPTCSNILPTEGNSNAYGFYATDNNGDFVSGVLHLYPNGFRHNAAVLIDQANSPSTDPMTVFDVSIPGGCTPGDNSRPATFNLTANGTPAATLQFGQPAGDPNATFAIIFSPLTGSQNTTAASPLSVLGGGASPMTGNAYLMSSQPAS